uniref:phosphoglycerate mutase (2,3-diphosphoglycerate-dependent) n=1 Tax=Timema californicum TaxID=61474 RepID=A0A7R9JGK6_TIMCA|nr:unnamed protein product [Timema californicum]
MKNLFYLEDSLIPKTDSLDSVDKAPSDFQPFLQSPDVLKVVNLPTIRGQVNGLSLVVSNLERTRTEWTSRCNILSCSAHSHGESEWNLKNLFCGWVDVDLSAKGREEAVTSGQALKQAGLKFDLAFTSLLKRAHQTLDIVLREIGQTDLPVVKSWRLNERHYGGLTGLNKADAAAKYGDKQVQIWRRSYNVPPPVMEEDHPMNNVIVNNPKFSMIRKEDFPRVESLETTQRRVVAFWTEEIVPRIKERKRVLVVAHGTSLRGLVKYLEGMANIVVVMF